MHLFLSFLVINGHDKDYGPTCIIFHCPKKLVQQTVWIEMLHAFRSNHDLTSPKTANATDEPRLNCSQIPKSLKMFAMFAGSRCKLFGSNVTLFDHVFARNRFHEKIRSVHKFNSEINVNAANVRTKCDPKRIFICVGAGNGFGFQRQMARDLHRFPPTIVNVAGRHAHVCEPSGTHDGEMLGSFMFLPQHVFGIVDCKHQHIINKQLIYFAKSTNKLQSVYTITIETRCPHICCCRICCFLTAVAELLHSERNNVAYHFPRVPAHPTARNNQPFAATIVLQISVAILSKWFVWNQQSTWHRKVYPPWTNIGLTHDVLGIVVCTHRMRKKKKSSLSNQNANCKKNQTFTIETRCPRICVVATIVLVLPPDPKCYSLTRSNFYEPIPNNPRTNERPKTTNRQRQQPFCDFNGNCGSRKRRKSEKSMTPKCSPTIDKSWVHSSVWRKMFWERSFATIIAFFLQNRAINCKTPREIRL